jgi:putative phosphoribosyl transferase
MMFASIPGGPADVVQFGSEIGGEPPEAGDGRAGLPARFADAREAGRALAPKLAPFASADDLVVVGLANGGVPVAFEVARALRAPLDVLLIRRLLVPRGAESQVCAVSACGNLFLDEGLPPRGDAPETPLEHFIADALAELAARVSECRGERPTLDLSGKVVLLVDNGILTGLTILACVRALRAFGPSRVVAAVPVAAPASRAAVEAVCDGLVCLAWPEPFGHVGLWYRDFERPGPADIREMLEQSEGARA